MPKIKLVQVHTGVAYDSYGDEIDSYISLEPLSDWTEVTDSEYNMLTSYDFLNKLKTKNSYYKVVLLREVEPTEIQGFIKDVKSFIKDSKKKQELEESKRKEYDLKRKAALEAKKIEKAKALLKKAGEL